VLFASGILVMLSCAPLFGSSEISDQQALEIAKKEIVKYHVDPRAWTKQIDKSLEEWGRKRRSWEEWMRVTKVQWPQRRIDEIESAIKGKKVWLVVFDRSLPPEVHSAHDHAIVFLDASSGEVISVIHPEE
jgi:hypothetical protein